MITLLLGTDALAKKQHIKLAANQRNAEIQIFSEGAALPSLDGLFEQQLFGVPKVVVLERVWKQLDPVELLDKLGDKSSASLFVLEDSLDKRKKVNQEFLNDSRVKVLQLDSPLGTNAASDWIINYCKEKGIAIELRASQSLSRALVLDEDSVLDVVRAQNEIEKLKHFASGKSITAEMVGELVVSVSGVDIFALLNAIATKNRKQALILLQNYFDTETADEKANAIKVAALLSDQFRSLLIVVDSNERRMPDEAILEITGWKSGRLYIMKKLSRNFTAQQLKQALSKLENLDRELKTGSMPPHVVLDLIIADM